MSQIPDRYRGPTQGLAFGEFGTDHSRRMTEVESHPEQRRADRIHDPLEHQA